MSIDDLVIDIKRYFGQIVVEKYLFKNPECLSLALDLIGDLVDIDPRFSLVLENVVDFSNLSEELLEKILVRLIRFDSQIKKFRKVH